MAITFNFELNHKPNRLGCYTIFLRITQDRKLKRVKTGIELSNIRDWNPKKQQVRTSEPNSHKYNDILDTLLQEAKTSYRELKKDGFASTEQVVRNLSEGEKPQSFLQYARQRTQEIYDAGNFRNWKRYNGFMNKLEAYLRDSRGRVRDLPFSELTPSFMAKYEAYLHTLDNVRQPGKKLHQNTIQVVFNIFRAIINRAIHIEHLMRPEQDPFLSYHCKGVTTSKEKLNISEIRQIEALELKEGSLLWHCRNYFLFSFYCAGIRIGDCIQLRWCNITADGRLWYQMGKNHKERDLKLVQQAQRILSFYYRPEAKSTDYIFPLLDASRPYAKAVTQEEKDTLPVELKIRLYNDISAKTALINKYLHELAQKAGIEKKVSFHVSRHSFAKVAKQRGTDNALLKELLAHSSVKITEGYMGSFDTTENDRALEHIFEASSEEKEKTELIALLQGMDIEKLKELLHNSK